MEDEKDTGILLSEEWQFLMGHADQGSTMVLCPSSDHLTVLLPSQISASFSDEVNTGIYAEKLIGHTYCSECQIISILQ